MNTRQAMRAILILFTFAFLLHTPVSAQTAQNEDLFGSTRIVVLSAYIGQTFSKGDYSYAPTIMIENGVYKMWWCGNIPGQFGDHIL